MSAVKVISELGPAVSTGFDMIKALSDCMGAVKAVFGAIDQIYQIYQRVQANNEKCIRLNERLQLLRPPLNKLNMFLQKESNEVAKKKKSAIEPEQASNLLQRL